MGILKILVVDDERDIRIFVSTVVETLGFEAIAANDGAQALEKASSNPPALVILDVMMPRIDDGIQTYQQFKTNPKLSDIPIIILSAIARKTFLHSIRMLSPRQGSGLASDLKPRFVNPEPRTQNPLNMMLNL
jgi:CheY-like chemotaxis protein